MKTTHPLKSVVVKSFCLFTSLALLLANLSASEDWPEFRGPGGQGHSSAKNVPVEWSANNNVAWKSHP